MGFDFNVIAPLLLAAFPLSLAMGYSFFGGLQHPPVNGCSAGICIFCALVGEDEHTSFYSAILLEKIPKRNMGESFFRPCVSENVFVQPLH